MAWAQSGGGIALNALGRILQGTGEGAAKADTLGQHQRALDLTERGQDLANPDLEVLGKALGLNLGAGRVPAALAAEQIKTGIKQKDTAAQQGRANEFADTLVRSTNKQVPVDPESLGMMQPGTTEVPTTQRADPRAALLAGMIKAQGAVTPADAAHLTEILGIKQQPIVHGTPGSWAYDPNERKFLNPPEPPRGTGPDDVTGIDLNSGQRTKTTRDSLTGRERTTSDMAPLSDQFTAHYNRAASLQRKQEAGQPLTPDERMQLKQSKSAMDNLKPFILPPGATQFERMPATPGAAPGGLPGAMRTNPTNPAGSDIKDAGDRNNIIQQLEGTSNLVRNMPDLQNASGRGSLAVRAFIQGRTPFETLTPQEQAYVVTHENLRQLLIQAQMGLGPFRSPEMQAQLQNTIGRYWTPGTAERLTALAELLRGQQSGIATAEQAGNRAQIHTPPPRANENQNPPQTKGAPVWQLRETATGRVRRYQPGPGETQPPAGYERVQ